MTSQLTTSGLLRLIGLAGIVTILFGSIVGHERILETSKGLLDSPLRQVRLASLPSFGKSWLRQPAINVSQIYVLSGSDYRRTNMQKLLTYLDQPYTFIEGPNVFEDPYDAIAKNESISKPFLDWLDKDRQKGSNFFRFTMGCTVGHRKVLMDALDNDYDSILVLEDDIDCKYTPVDFHVFNNATIPQVDVNIRKIMLEVFKQVPSDWDILFLGYSEPRWWSDDPAPGSLVRRLRKAYQTHAYIVKKSAMEKIVQATEEYWKIPYDHLILDRMLASQQLIAYATTPMLSMQCATVPSGIENRLKSFGRGDFHLHGLAWTLGMWQEKISRDHT